MNYKGSCGIDEDLLEATGILPFEKIELYNVSNGERFSTYAPMSEEEIKTYVPKVVFVDDENRITGLKE